MEFNSITISGNLLSSEFIAGALQWKNALDGFEPATFDPIWTSTKDFEAHLTQTFRDLETRYLNIRQDLPNFDVSETREQWVLPLLRALGFEPIYNKAHLEIGTMRFPISHMGSNGTEAPPIHSVAISESLDARDTTKRGSKSPQKWVQEFLNQSKPHDWGILTNGKTLRLLRDYYHTTTPGYIQWDLMQMFESRDTDAWRAMFRLAHTSRFTSRDDGKPWLEAYYERSRAEGSRAEADLRKNVRDALEVLGNGLMTDSMRSHLIERPDRTEDYHRELLRIVYRIIFLLYAEQRGLVPEPTAPQATIYRQNYSVANLRDQAERPSLNRDSNHDLWEGLVQTFRAMHEGCAPLGVQGFNGNLFDPELTWLAVGPLEPDRRALEQNIPRFSNTELLEVMAHLGYTSRGKVRERINYRDLAVEEIGHIYEGLLDYAPRIALEATAIETENRVITSSASGCD